MEQKLLNDAAQCAIKFVDEFDGSGAKNKCYQMMKVIATLTLDDIKNDKNQSKHQYTVNNILDKLYFSDREPTDSDSKNVSRYFRALKENLSEYECDLKRIALENKLGAIPVFKKISGGGRANYTTYHIVSKKLLEIEQLPESSQDPLSNEIRYSIEMIDNLPRWLRWINGFELSGVRLKVLASVVIIAMIGCLLLVSFFALIFQSSESSGLMITRAFISISVIIFAIASPFRLLYLCVNNRIIMAPNLFVPHTLNNAQLECIATDKIRESTGRYIRTIRMVSYVSTCPLCNSRVEVESGKSEFHGRLIGRCAESPMEHVYSFDRVLRIGRPLRS